MYSNDKTDGSKYWTQVAEGVAAFLHLAILIVVIVYWNNTPNSRVHTTQTVQAITEVSSNTEVLDSLVNLTHADIVQDALYNTPFLKLKSFLDYHALGHDGVEVCYNRTTVKTIQWGNSSRYQSTMDLQQGFVLYKWPLIFVFTLTTFLFHAYRAFYIEGFWEYTRHNYPRLDRWIEYSVSSPLMIMLIACSAGTLDWGQLLLLFASQFVLVVLGAAVELCLTLSNAEFKPDSYLQPHQTRLVQLPHLNFTLMAWIFTLFSWALFAFQWIVIWINLTGMLNVFQCLNDESLSSRTQIPIIIVSLQFIFFALFGLWQFVDLFGSGGVLFEKHSSFGITLNYGYIFLSFTAKCILAILLVVEANQFKID